MGDVRDPKKDRLKKLKEHVNARDYTHSDIKRTRLKRQDISPVSETVPTASRSESHTHEEEKTSEPTPMPARKKKQTFRTRAVLAGLVFFIATAGLSVLFLLSGQNTISGSNIVISVDGPFAVGGGESYPLQISIANQNTVIVESGTLIIEYPQGTQSDDESGAELFRERIPLEDMNPGAVVNISRSARVFGEENEEKLIRVSVEYRVAGSNATFFKEAEPLRFKISSSPVVLSLDTVQRITSGQELEMTLTVSSNSEAPIQDLLIQADYPPGFDYTTSNPSPVGGQNVWRFAELDPESEEEITISGILTGTEGDERVFRFSSGVPNERDNLALSSVFSSVSSEVVLEGGFFNVSISVNGSNAQTVAVPDGDDARVDLVFTNTLSEPIYDANLAVELSGNALDDQEVQASQGFYDSSANTIRWSANDLPSFREIRPGQTRSVSFTVGQGSASSGRTPQITFSTSLSGKRVSETRVPETLVNKSARTIRFESVAALASQVQYNLGSFTNAGPVPPVAERATQYTVQLVLENGSNDITNAEVSASLPSYVTWLDITSSGDDVSFNNATREVTWDAGDVSAGGNEAASFQISVLPSISQVGTVPTIVGEQRLRAEDRFTGTVIRSTAPALTTRIFNTADADNDGRVQSAQ